jgi:ABC-type transport system substrate-binding protein
MRNLKLYYLYAITFLKRRKLLVFLSFLLVVSVVIAVVLLKNSIKSTVHISEGVIGTYTENDLPEVVTRLLSQGLVKIDDSGFPMPAIAKSWEVNSAGTLYTIKLDNGLNFTDGTKLDAKNLDIRINGVDTFIVDDSTIQFKIADSFSPFVTLLNHPFFKKQGWVGTGPYSISKIDKDDNNFIQTIHLKSKDASLPLLDINFYQNEKTAKTALNLGEVQAVLGLSDLSDMTKSKTFNSYEKTNFTQLVTIFYDTKDKVLSDENLRQALSFAAPHIEGETRSYTSIPPTNWAFNKDVKDYLDNPEGAKTALKKVQNLKDTQVTLTATSSLQKIGQAVVDAWNAVGIKSKLIVESGVPQTYQALLIAQNIPVDPDQYALWHSTQTQTNKSNFSNPRVDKDLEDGRRATDSAVRKTKYQDFQKVLLDHAPATFLYFPKYQVEYLKKIEAPLLKVLQLQLP